MSPLRRLSGTGLLALLIVYFVWGGTYLAIRYAVRDGSGFPPFSMAASRTLLGGAILLFIGLLWKQRVRLSRTEALWLTVSAVLMWNGGNGMVTWAEQRAHSGYAALVVGTTPIFSAVIESLFNRRRPSRGLIGALLVGFAGLFLLTWPVIRAGTRGDTVATLALVAAPFCWSLGSTIQQRHPMNLPVVVSAGWQQVIGALGFVLLLGLAGEPVPHPSPAAWWAWGYLVIFGSVLSFTAYVVALRRLPMPVVMTYAYVNPVIAVLLGWFFLHEDVTLTTACGMALILTGVAGVFRQKQPSAGGG